MPLQIPAASFVVFAQLMGGAALDASNATWHIADRDQRDNTMMVSGFRQIDTKESCLEFAAVTLLQYADGSISYSCAAIEPAAALVAVSGPEQVLRDHGYEFTYER